jgi:hypothetical protein
MKPEFMLTNYVAFAYRIDQHRLSRRSANYVVDGDCCSRRLVFLPGVMPFVCADTLTETMRCTLPSAMVANGLARHSARRRDRRSVAKVGNHSETILLPRDKPAPDMAFLSVKQSPAADEFDVPARRDLRFMRRARRRRGAPARHGGGKGRLGTLAQ